MLLIHLHKHIGLAKVCNFQVDARRHDNGAYHGYGGVGGGGRSGSTESWENENGLCIDDTTLTAACLFGSTLQQKMAEAVLKCPEPVETEHSWRPRGRNSATCPTFNEITVKLQERYGQVGCMLKSLGWADEAYDAQTATYEADVASLNPALLEGITAEAIQDCVNNKVNDMTQGREGQLIQRCSSNYTAEELAIVAKIISGVAGFQCFRESFDTACKSYIDTTYVQPLIASLVPAIVKYPY